MSTAKPKIAVIGAGGVGTTLGQLWLDAGYPLKYGSRDPASAKTQELLSKQAGATADTVAAACSWADVIVLTVPGEHTDEGNQRIAASLGEGAKGKLLIDATNPCTEFPLMEVRWKQGTSGAEVLQAALPGTAVYKAYNTIPMELMNHPKGDTISAWSGGAMSLFFCGAPERQAEAAAIISATGWVPAYVGPIRYARNLEAMAELYIHIGVPPAGMTSVNWGRNWAFQPIGADLGTTTK